MAAKGTSEKNAIISKLKEVFPDSFIASDGKTLRIPMNLTGEPVEIKVVLTCAKDLEGTGGIAPITVSRVNKNDSAWGDTSTTAEKVNPAVPTEQEKQNVSALLSALGIV